MAITLQSHQVDIRAYADGLRKELNEAECLYDWATTQLDLTTWKSADGLWKAEVLLTYGGLRHSWGANAITGEAQTSLEFEHSGLTDAICEIKGLG